MRLRTVCSSMRPSSHPRELSTPKYAVRPDHSALPIPGAIGAQSPNMVAHKKNGSSQKSRARLQPFSLADPHVAKRHRHGAGTASPPRWQLLRRLLEDMPLAPKAQIEARA